MWVNNVTIRGRGILSSRVALENYQRAMLIYALGVSTITIEGVTLREPGSWTLDLCNSWYGKVENVKVVANFVNSDGFVVGGTSQTVVQDSFCHNADDAFEVKGWIPMTDVTFSNCVCWSDVGICFGLAWDVPASVSDVWFKNCTVIHDLAATTAQPAVGMCVIVDPTTGVTNPGSVSGITFQNIVIEDVTGSLIAPLKVVNNWSGGGWQMTTDGPTLTNNPYVPLDPPACATNVGPISNVTFINIQVLNSVNPAIAVISAGSNAPINNVSFNNVSINGNPVTRVSDPRIYTNQWVYGLTVTLRSGISLTAVTSSSNPSVYGQSGVTFTATVTNAPGSSGTPTGTVQFQINGVNFGSAVTLSGGSATSGALPTTLPAGNYTVTAVYSGDTNFNSSTSSLVQTVKPVHLINVQFGPPNTTNYTGPGPILGSAGDYWNAVTNVSGYPIGDIIWPLNDNSNHSTAVSIDISAPVWINWELYPYGGGSWHNLVESMVQFWGNDTTVTFSGLDNTKIYDIYVLNSPYNVDTAMVIVNGVTNTIVPTADFNSVWVAGQNYVDYLAVPTDGSGNIVVGVDFLPGGSSYTRLVGMQIYAEPPTVTFLSQPQSVTNAPGGTVVLSCTVTGGSGTPTYQWQVMVGGTYVNMPGQTNSTLTITNLQPSDDTNYQVIAIAGTSATSNPATITVLTNPNTSISLNSISPSPEITILNGTAGFHYQVQYETALGTNWLLLQDIPSLPTNPFEVFDPTPANQGARFYKAVVLP